MRKLLFLIPLIIVFVSACADIDQTQSKKYTEDNSTNQPVNPGGNNGGQTNPDGDGNDNGTTTDPVEPGGDGNDNGTNLIKKYYVKVMHELLLIFAKEQG